MKIRDRGSFTANGILTNVDVCLQDLYIYPRRRLWSKARRAFCDGIVSEREAVPNALLAESRIAASFARSESVLTR